MEAIAYQFASIVRTKQVYNCLASSDLNAVSLYRRTKLPAIQVYHLKTTIPKVYES
jgi:hypothetical protein